MKRHSHCLAFSSASPQSQTYYVTYDSYTEHLRWHRTASKVLEGLCVFVFVLRNTLIVMVVAGISTSAVPHFHELLITLSLSDCLSEGELSRPVVLQPGGAACSALLQPRHHTPQSQKQLHITAQRCSSTHQVSFCH